MRKLTWVVVAFLCATAPAIPQQAGMATRDQRPGAQAAFTRKKSDIHVFGHVLSVSTRKHIPFVTVALKGTAMGTSTDESGHYTLKNLPEGTFTLVVSGVGYRTAEKTVTLKKGLATCWRQTGC